MPGLCFSNHEASGETILRTGKVILKPHDLHGIWNYAKLCYNTKYPWESAPVGCEGVETQQYVLRDTLTDGKAKAVVLKGKDFTGQEKQLAMTIYDGWDELALAYSTGTNPDSECSIVAYAQTARQKHYGNEYHILISQVITKESREDFTEDEIFPIQEVEYTDPETCGGYGPVTVILKTGEKREIDFEAMEGKICI